MSAVKKIQPQPPPPVYQIEITEKEIDTLVKILKATTYGLSCNLLRQLSDAGVNGTGYEEFRKCT
jgi:hypothetical protein